MYLVTKIHGYNNICSAYFVFFTCGTAVAVNVCTSVSFVLCLFLFVGLFCRTECRGLIYPFFIYWIYSPFNNVSFIYHSLLIYAWFTGTWWDTPREVQRPWSCSQHALLGVQTSDYASAHRNTERILTLVEHAVRHFVSLNYAIYRLKCMNIRY